MSKWQGDKSLNKGGGYIAINTFTVTPLKNPLFLEGKIPRSIYIIICKFAIVETNKS